MMKKIILISGDPNSINSEIIFKSWKKIEPSIKKKIYLITNFKLINEQFNKLNYKIKTIKVANINETLKRDELKILNVDIKFKHPFKISKKNVSKFIEKSFNLAHKLANFKNVSGIVNCPINKELLNQKNPGITEYLASKCNIKNNSEAMLIYNKKLSVSPITTHVEIKNISKKIKKSKIEVKVKTIDRWFKKIKKRKPRIAMLGLNPHNAELIKNSEEIKIIIPTIKKLRKLGINIKGPYIADTIFIKDYKNFDVIIGMYHDQVLAPFKTLFKFDAINITLGLKYLRTSPDHGVARNIIGKNKADPNSLISCLKFLNKKK
jgi:4-hydroxy-L-threonine phosphate dehydrogenase PdxA